MASDSDAFWLKVGGPLRFYAARVTNMIVTISDVERTHKVYSLIHTSTRASTDNARVDRLALASAILKSDVKAKPFFKRLEEFERLSEDQLSQIVAWGDVIVSATQRTARSIQTPLPEIALVAESVQNDTAVVDGTESPCEVPIEAESSDEEEEVVAAPVATGRRPARAQRFTAKFVAAAVELGLSNLF